ncbi:MAG: DUF131 domain-containing protein [Thermoplasmata archaeon]|nr:DUF131 domain-containing protein [Thermoplasmata archaeon]
MRPIVRVVGPFALIVGGILLADALLTGAARVYLLLIVPVITGTTALFALAVTLLLVGVLFLPLTFAGANGQHSEPSAHQKRDTLAPQTASGGVIFIGPVPIFFGRWRKHPPISYRWALLLGVALVVVVVVLLLWGFAAL